MEDVLRADYGDAAQKALNDAARAKSKPSSTVSDRRYPPSPASPVREFHIRFLFRENPNLTPPRARMPRPAGPEGARAGA